MGKDSSSKHRPLKPVKTNSSRHRASSGSHKTNGTRSTGNVYPLSFLFAISQIDIKQHEIDTWGNARPPTSPTSYEQRDDLMTTIMLYDDGTIINVSHIYYWGRDDTGVGAIWTRPDPQSPSYRTITHAQSTICSCHPLLPFAMVKTDPTVDETQVLADGAGPNEFTWEPLRFFFPLDNSTGRTTGVSQAVFTCSLGPDALGGAPRTHIAGRNASWLGTLVPSSYENPSSGAPSSRGLGGDLTILLGLMAFASSGREGLSRAETVFLFHQRWRNRRWYNERSLPSFIRSASDPPEGLVVTVAYDPSNPLGSSEDTLNSFECYEVAVKE